LTEQDPGEKVPGPDGRWENAYPDGKLPGIQKFPNRIFLKTSEEVLEEAWGEAPEQGWEEAPEQGWGEAPEQGWEEVLEEAREEADTDGAAAAADHGTAVRMIFVIRSSVQ